MKKKKGMKYRPTHKIYEEELIMASAGKGTGHKKGMQESFELKERKMEYNRRNSELVQKMTDAKKDIVIQLLLKQQKDLKFEFHDVLLALASAAPKRKSSAAKKQQTQSDSQDDNIQEEEV